MGCGVCLRPTGGRLGPFWGGWGLLEGVWDVVWGLGHVGGLWGRLVVWELIGGHLGVRVGKRGSNCSGEKDPFLPRVFCGT